MNRIIVALCVAAFILSFVNGTANELSNAALSECAGAVTLCISLCGTICFWSGMMNIAEKSGAVSFVSKLVSPILRLLFPGLSQKSRAMDYIVLNFVSNLLGLGNASTPLGIKALKHLKDEENAGEAATGNMITLIVMNTASLQLFPTTIAAIRAKYGSAAPSEIIPCVWLTSAAALFTALSAVKAFSHIHSAQKRRRK